MGPRRFALEVRGHLFDFQVLKSGALRVAGVDGRWNSRLDSARRMCSSDAWKEAQDAAMARIEEPTPADRAVDRRPAPRPVMPALPPKLRARRNDAQLSLGGVL